MLVERQVGHQALQARILLADLLEYRERRRERQYDMLAATRDAVDEDNIEQTLEDLKAARKAVAARRATRL